MKRAIFDERSNKESDSELFSLKDSSSEFNLSSGDEEQDCINSEEIKEDCFVLIKFVSKSSVTSFVGRVMAFVNETEIQVQFLRRKTGTSQFYYPIQADIATVPRDDITKLLPHPMELKGTSRTQSVVVFKINFDKYGCVK